ncbi:MAG: alpha/beta hydrolase [Planctomycetaceae bacterium]|nr:alpha/beta hydrolase [Planctomycetaceae bacterium]
MNRKLVLYRCALTTAMGYYILAQFALGGDPANSVSAYTIHRALPFSETAKDLRLDLYVPNEAAQPVPCVIVIQGGGFLPQDGQRFRPFAECLAKNGLAAALISYRGRPDHTYRDTIADTKATVRFVRCVSKQYHIDPERIGATGRSAGGTLAALLAVTGGMEEFEGDGGHPEFSSRIQAAVAFAGVFDFVTRFTDEQQIALQPKYKAKIQTNGQWIGTPFSAEDRDWLNASAIRHVDKGDAPTLFLHCKDDATVPWPQSRDMCERMKAAGVRSEVKYYDTGGHGFSGLAEGPMEEMVRFFRETL